MDFFTDIAYWKYASIPVVAALVGWSTNWVAIKLLFFPVKPLGWPPYFGWHGIIPSKAGKMGAITTDTTLTKLGSLTEMFGAMEPDRIAAHLVETINPQIETLADALMQEENPKVWELVPHTARLVIYELVRRRMPDAIREMMHDVGDHIEAMVDLREMVVRQLEAAPHIVNRIFLECGAEEFKFIIRSGLYFGFGFGLVQMGIWILYPAWWILPLFGVIVGYATNWIALRVVFQPLQPRRVGPFTVQGLFLKRQKEVSAIWCRIVTREVLTIHHIIDAMLHGPKQAYTREVIRRHILKVVDESLGITRPVAQLTIGPEAYAHLKESVSEQAMLLTAAAFDDPEFNEERAQVVQGLMQKRMEALSPEEFQYLLRPAFEEEELKLILMGALLGFGAGLVQLYWVFGG